MQLIEHKIYGKGRILKKRFGKFELHVEFEDGVKRWVRRDEVRFLSETPLLTKHESPKSTLSPEQCNARQIIEALRLGVVPQKYVEELTFGREKEIKEIMAWLNRPNSGSLIISGEYGVGKTHLLEYIYSLALKNNWAVSVVELDPNEVPFHKPKAIYEKVVHSLRFDRQNRDFREFLRYIAKSSEFYKLKEHKYLIEIIEKIRNGTDDEDDWEWIEGGYTSGYYPPMYEASTCANIYCYILSGIGWAAKNILGMNGFLILFDEMEITDPYWYSPYQNTKVWNFLTGLILMTNNDQKLLQEVKENKFYEHRIYKGRWGEYTNLQYCGWSQLPFIWKIPCYVKAVFTFTPTFILEREPLINVDKLELEHIAVDSLERISERISELYAQAYNFRANRDNCGSIPKDKTRLFIKSVVEYLDIIRSRPGKPVGELSDDQ